MIFRTVRFLFGSITAGKASGSSGIVTLHGVSLQTNGFVHVLLHPSMRPPPLRRGRLAWRFSCRLPLAAVLSRADTAANRRSCLKRSDIGCPADCGTGYAGVPAIGHCSDVAVAVAIAIAIATGVAVAAALLTSAMFRDSCAMDARNAAARA